MYVRRINVVGNTRTRDEVVRREMRQLESSWFDSNRLALSKDRINRLGYFTDVDVTTVPVEGTPDQVDVDVKVSEKPTGAITLGAAYTLWMYKRVYLGDIANDDVRALKDINAREFLILAVLAYYFIGIDQCAVSVFGDTSYIHALVHDARHFLGFPCH